MHLVAAANDPTLKCDICVVGSGPAGATLVRELAGSGLDIVLVESGGYKRSADRDALNEVENVGAARNPDHTAVRCRVLGGTSHLWTGRCASLDEIDYEKRSWVPFSGWPIGAADMEPYLQRSSSYLGLGIGAGFTGEGFWRLTGRARPPRTLDSEKLRSFFWQFSRNGILQAPVRFDTDMTASRHDTVRLLTNTTAVHINTNAEASMVESLEVALPDDRRQVVFARAIVLCTGGIENARLLLTSNRAARNGLGNRYDLVGRFLMDHPRGGVAVFDPRKAATLHPYFGFHTVRTKLGTNLFCQGLCLDPAIQAKERLLNCAVWLSELVALDDPWSAIKRIASGRAHWWRDAFTLVRHGDLVARGLHRSLLKGGGVIRKLYGLELNCIVEQAPDPDSRVTLSRRTDRHGIPLPRIDWRISDQEMRTVRRCARLVVETLNQAAIAPPVLEDWVRDDQPFPSSFGDVAHHIGTTRMADHPSRGVVDADCAVHDVAGLYIAGSSVFPTGGHANPTQMIVALAIRLADTLKRRLAPRSLLHLTTTAEDAPPSEAAPRLPNLVDLGGVGG